MSSYASLSTAELENLLRRPDVPAREQQAIEQELSRRYTSEYLGQGGPATPPPVAPRPMPPAPPPAMRQEWRPPVAPAPAATPGKSGAAAKAVGCFVAVLIALAIGVLFALYDDSGDPVPTSGTVCVVPGGDYCPLGVGLPKGAACVCSDGVTAVNGVVQ